MPVDVKMPQLGESVTEGTIGRWLKQPGDPIKRYEPLLEVTTDKVDTEIPSTVDGTVLELLVPEGETVKVGTLIARLSEQGDALTSFDTLQTTSSDERPAPGAIRSADGGGPSISPVVARLAAEHSIDLSQIRGTGANGRVTKKDVEQYLLSRDSQPADSTSAASVQPAQSALLETMHSGPQSGAHTEPLAADPARPQPAASAPAGADVALEPGDELVPLSAMRRAIAEHMVRSRRIAPRVTTIMEADLTRVAAHRARLADVYARQGVRLTYTAYVVEAAVAALRAVPAVNASFQENGIVFHRRIDVGIAVAITDGLIVPVIKDAGDKSLLGLARAVNDLSDRARTRRLQPDDTHGGTFTITNHGVSGSLFATPIINQPQAAILGVGAIEKRPVVIEQNGQDAIAVRLRAYLSLTFDHRIVDGATADEFLTVVKHTLEEYT